jgi:glyceraldehyde 3-phosphate dehydrogenase
MSKVKIGINGFGRIGRTVMRVLTERTDEFEVAAINDLTDPKVNAHLFKYDSVMGKYGGEVQVRDGAMVIDGREIKVLAERSPKNLPWGELGVDVVLESTGIFATREGDRGGYGDHILAGADKVLLSVPSKDEIDATIVLGVNDDQLKAGDRCVSNASCTTNCLAPLAKTLHNAFGIERGLMTTVHAYTNDQPAQDFAHSDLRRARAAAANIIPTTTGAARAVGKVIPDLNGKLDGFAMRVPVITGSVVDLVAELKEKVTAEQINEAVKAAAEGELKGILEYCDEPIVSSDIVGNSHSSIFDSLLTMVLPKDGSNLVKVVSWYDNEWGYSCRSVDLMKIMANL